MSTAAARLAGLALISLAGVVAVPSFAQDGTTHLERQQALSAAREAERARVTRLRWEQERRRSAAHARMSDTMYGSTPSRPAAELSCPVVPDDDVRRAMQDFTSADDLLGAPLLSQDWLGSRDGGAFRSPPLAGAFGASSGSWDAADAVAHDAWSPAFATSSSSDATGHLVPLFPSASDPALQGFARVINRAGDAGEVQIEAVDDTGMSYGPLTLSIDGHQTVHFNSNDLEEGNPGKGLTGSTGVGEGDWRLTLTSDLDLEVLSYIRTRDGFLTAMHDLAPVADGVHRIAIFNPGSNTSQVSRLRLLNTGEEAAEVTIEGTDDRGMSPGSAVEVTVAAGASDTLTAAELESGGTGMTGALGDGAGKWRLAVTSDQPIHALSLLSSPTGHLTNLSTAPSNAVDGVHEVALFPSASDASGRQGFVRVINPTEETAEITIAAHDETAWEYDVLTLTVAGGEVAHFNSNDLEQGNVGKGLTGSTGAGEGDWRLTLSSDSDIEVLAYIRTTDGFLTAMHDVAPVSDTHHRVAIFNPGSNTAQVSRLRLVNAGDEMAEVSITGTDDRGTSPGSDVSLSVPAGGTRTYTAQQLESGGEGLEGALSDGAGKWRLEVTSDQPIRVLSLLSSPTGHLTNLSTAPRDAVPAEMAEEVFRTLISPIVQSKCVTCHMEGRVSGSTRLVFVTDDDAEHLTKNLSVFETFLEEVEDGAAYILNKVQGALGHGGGIQVAAGTDEFSDMERFLGLLEGQEVGPVAITPANLFDGVKMESWRSTLRRAAIVFAGRIPTLEEYESIRGATVNEFRAAIRSLMHGPGFHEFLIRSANDRLLTDRDRSVIDATASDDFVDFANLYYDQVRNHYESGGPDPWQWYRRAQYGVRRAPLELIAHVVENDLPYTEVLTADYIMANPVASAAYGASTAFRNVDDDHEFRPSEIVSYYRDDESKVSEFFTATQLGGSQAMLVRDPGDLATDYPHAGILNTTVFLLRYPTTATNRNRARSRWTYYHFLGLDVEKSASRTTDPVALADINNPTMHNPACTVCHTVLDPVAGAFQNYGPGGFYRDQWGGLDSLDGLYKEGSGTAREFEITATGGREAQTIGVSAWLKPGRHVVSLSPYFDPPKQEDEDIWWNMGIDRVEVFDTHGQAVDSVDVATLDLECGRDEPVVDDATGDRFYEAWFCPQDIPFEVQTAGVHEVGATLWIHAQHEDVTDERRLVEMRTGGYQEGDTWYRDVRDPGFDGDAPPDQDNSLQWLAERMVADDRFAEATVKFWWPAVMGADVTAPPLEGDPDFESRLLASNAQSAEVERLARGFRRGFGGGAPYNLKDLLAEIVLSRWFRAHSLADVDPVRATALADAGAIRLLTPEELARKTVALTGFDWKRGRGENWRGPGERLNWTGAEDEYGLLYGGIDSGGITRRGRDLTSIMAGVARRHAAAVSCPVVMKDFYLLSEDERRLFGGIDRMVTPVSEFGSVFEISASSRADAETVSVGGDLTAGRTTVTLSFLNDEVWFEGIEGDRQLRLDRLTVRNAAGEVVAMQELEDSTSATGCEWNAAEHDHFALYCEGSVDVEFDVPAGGRYDIEVVAWAYQYGDALAQLEVSVGTDSSRSTGSRVIKRKLAELYETLLGVENAAASAEVEAAYGFFVDVWRQGRQVAGDSSFAGSMRCDWAADSYYLDGIANAPLWHTELNEWGNESGWDWNAVDEFFRNTPMPDPQRTVQTWVVVLAYLMSDYRYLHL